MTKCKTDIGKTLYRAKEKLRHFDLLNFLHVYTNIIEFMLLLNMHVTIRIQIKQSHAILNLLSLHSLLTAVQSDYS